MKIYLRTQLQSSVKTAEWNFVRLSRSNIRLNLPYSIHATRLLRQPGFVMVCKYFDICDQTRKIWAYFSVYVPCFHRYVSKCKLYVTGRAKYDTKIAIYGPCTGWTTFELDLRPTIRNMSYFIRICAQLWLICSQARIICDRI